MLAFALNSSPPSSPVIAQNVLFKRLPVIHGTVKDIPVYLGQQASCNSVESLRILVLISISDRRAECRKRTKTRFLVHQLFIRRINSRKPLASQQHQLTNRPSAGLLLPYKILDT